MIQFYCPDILETLTLPESDSAHCVRVLRKRIGDEVVVVDGRGNRYTCVIAEDHPKRTRLSIVTSEAVPRVWPADITVAVAPTKNMDRMEWLVEKLTEIGVDRIVPLLCRHSERREIKTERLNKIAVSAMKQSLKALLPAVSPMTPIAKFIAEDNSEQKFIAYCDPSIPRRLLVDLYRPGLSTSILIGPEGDFDPGEIHAALDAGYRPISLGDNRLRTETAALVAADTCHILNQYAAKQQSELSQI